MTKIYIVHGFGASPKRNWFPWISKKIGVELKIPTTVIKLPKPKLPQLAAWLETLRGEIGTPDRETYIIAHSLGCVTLLKYVETLPENVKIGGIILVSGFDEHLALLPILNGFTETKPDYAKIVPKIEKCRVICSDNDLVVPNYHTKKIADALGVAVTEISGGGHFTGQDGFKKFDEAYGFLKAMLP